MRGTLAIAALALLAACAPAPHPQQADIESASHIIEGWKVGDLANDVAHTFDYIPQNEVHKVGWIGGDKYTAAEGVTSSLSVGYYYMSGNVGMYPIVDRKIMAVVTVKDGRVVSIYRP